MLLTPSLQSQLMWALRFLVRKFPCVWFRIISFFRSRTRIRIVAFNMPTLEYQLGCGDIYIPMLCSTWLLSTFICCSSIYSVRNEEGWRDWIREWMYWVAKYKQDISSQNSGGSGPTKKKSWMFWCSEAL